MVTDSPTETLEAEHRVIAKVIGAVPVLADQLDAGQAVDVGLLRDIVEFVGPLPTSATTARRSYFSSPF